MVQRFAADEPTRLPNLEERPGACTLLHLIIIINNQPVNPKTFDLGKSRGSPPIR
jgi:hypothetical protein